MKTSVLVTTYRRRPYLEACLRSLLSQSRPPDEIVVVTRAGDEETRIFVAGMAAGRHGPTAIRHAEVAEPGVLAANRAGLPLVTGEILCFIDDDAAARPDWIARIEERFSADPRLGALGGRDLCHTAAGVHDEPAREVGRIRWYGRIVGDHHKRLPGVHAVEALKGCNMSFRRSLVAGFDEGIIGNAHYYEMDLCFAVRRAGRRVLYDGDLVVDHFAEAPRHLPGNADMLDPRRHYYVHHNRAYVMMKNLPLLRRAAFLAYTFLSDAAVGLARMALGRPEGRREILLAAFRGKIDGVRHGRSARRRAGTAPAGARG